MNNIVVINLVESDIEQIIIKWVNVIKQVNIKQIIIKQAKHHLSKHVTIAIVPIPIHSNTVLPAIHSSPTIICMNYCTFPDLAKPNCSTIQSFPCIIVR